MWAYTLVPETLENFTAYEINIDTQYCVIELDIPQSHACAAEIGNLPSGTLSGSETKGWLYYIYSFAPLYYELLPLLM